MTEESELLKELREIKSEIKRLSENVEKISFIVKEKWEREEDERLGGIRRDISDYLDDYLDYVERKFYDYEEKKEEDEEED